MISFERLTSAQNIAAIYQCISPYIGIFKRQRRYTVKSCFVHKAFLRKNRGLFVENSVVLISAWLLRNKTKSDQLSR